MKKLLAALLAASLSCAPAFAANAATAQTALPIRVAGVGPVTPIVITFDTVDSDLTVYTPDSDKIACIVGWSFSETSATNMTVKSGTTTNVALELAANQGVGQGIGNNLIICTQPGEALKLRVSTVISSMLLYVVQASSINLTGR